MFSLNGVPLDNDDLGWSLQVGSHTVVELRAILADVAMPGVDGVAWLAGVNLDASMLPLRMRVESAGVEAFNALLKQSPLTLTRSDRSGVECRVELASTRVIDDQPALGWALIEVTLRSTSVYWRDTDASTSSLTAFPTDEGSVGVTGLWSGLSGPVQDAIVRVRGPVAGCRVTDSGGSWVAFPTVEAGTYLRFEAEPRRAFVTGTDTWTGGTEVSGSVDYDGPRGGFEVAPYFVNGDPSAREGRVTATRDTPYSSGAAVEVRGRGAYLIT